MTSCFFKLNKESMICVYLDVQILIRLVLKLLKNFVKNVINWWIKKQQKCQNYCKFINFVLPTCSLFVDHGVFGSYHYFRQNFRRDLLLERSFHLCNFIKNLFHIGNFVTTNQRNFTVWNMLKIPSESWKKNLWITCLSTFGIPFTEINVIFT